VTAPSIDAADCESRSACSINRWPGEGTSPCATYTPRSGTMPASVATS
jgi:hypothetical protein